MEVVPGASTLGSAAGRVDSCTCSPPLSHHEACQGYFSFSEANRDRASRSKKPRMLESANLWNRA